MDSLKGELKDLKSIDAQKQIDFENKKEPKLDKDFMGFSRLREVTSFQFNKSCFEFIALKAHCFQPYKIGKLRFFLSILPLLLVEMPK